MQCPVCGERLREIEKEGIQLDLCPGCKGAWLERGALEKMIVGYTGSTASIQAVPAASIPMPPATTSVPPASVQGEVPSYQNGRYPRTESFPTHRREYDSDSDDDYDHHGKQHGHGYSKQGYSAHGHRRKGLLGNLMDMFGD